MLSSCLIKRALLEISLYVGKFGVALIENQKGINFGFIFVLSKVNLISIK